MPRVVFMCGPAGFVITPELAARYFDHFEPPTVEEGPLTILG